LSGSDVPIEGGYVCAPREIDNHRLVRSSGVILAELVSEPASVHSYNSISGCVEVRSFAVKLAGENLFFETSGRSIERLFDYKAEKAAETLGPREGLAR
jgi:hypothetical protein